MMDWIKGLLGRVWFWLVSAAGALVIFAGIYFSGRAKRKGEVELAIATHELDRANKAHEATTKKLEGIRERQVKLVSQILEEQSRRFEEAKRTRGLTDEQVMAELRERGDILPHDD